LLSQILPTCAATPRPYYNKNKSPICTFWLRNACNRNDCPYRPCNGDTNMPELTSVGLALFTTLFYSKNMVQLMTAVRLVQLVSRLGAIAPVCPSLLTNLTPGSESNPTLRRPSCASRTSRIATTASTTRWRRRCWRVQRRPRAWRPPRTRPSPRCTSAAWTSAWTRRGAVHVESNMSSKTYILSSTGGICRSLP
jgi:hypothetical protein